MHPRNQFSIGTAIMAPELVQRQGDRVDELSDIYALSVLLWELHTGCIPWNGKSSSEIRTAVLTNNRPPFPASDRVSPYRELIQKCWDADMSKRPQSFGMVVEMLEDLRRSADATVDNLVLKYTPEDPNPTENMSYTAQRALRSAAEDVLRKVIEQHSAP